MELDSLSLGRPALPADDLRLHRLLCCPVPIVMAGGKRLRDDLRLRRLLCGKALPFRRAQISLIVSREAAPHAARRSLAANQGIR